MLKTDAGTDSIVPTYGLFVLVRRGRLALGRKLQATAALSLLRAQQGDILGPQELVIVDEATGATVSENDLEERAGVGASKDEAFRPLATPAWPQIQEMLEELDAPSSSSRSPSAAERYQRAAEHAQRVQAEYLRVHEACMDQLRSRPVLRPKQITQIEWMTRASAVQFAEAVRSCRALHESVAAIRRRS